MAIDPALLYNTAPVWSPSKYDYANAARWIVVHTQQARSSARGLANYCAQRGPQVSYHGTVDESESIQLVRFEHSPWAASNANTEAEHLCFGGSFAEWTRAQWLDPDKDEDGINQDKMLTRGAAWVAWRCLENNLPIEYVGNKNRGPYPPARHGVCGHGDFGAWGGGHTDPGTSFPWDIFISRAKALAEGSNAWDRIMLELNGK
jgi:hypothetical protein